MRAAARGGSKRGRVDSIDELAILACLLRHLAVVADMGLYEGKGRSDQPDGVGILILEPMLSELLTLCPAADFGASALKKVCLKLVFQHAALNNTVYNNGVWAGLRNERFVTIFYHLRKIKREPDRLRQVLEKLTGPQTSKLHALLAKIRHVPGSEPAIANSDADTVDMPRTCDVTEPVLEPPPEQMQSGPKRLRTLKHRPSDVSVDSQGFPSMLSPPSVADVPVAMRRACSSSS